MGSNNTEWVITKANIHISNINRLLKEVKSNISVDFIQSDNKRLIITTNKVAAASDLKYNQKIYEELENDIDHSNIMSPRLPQSKFYLKILGILYFIENINLPISSNIVESIIKSTHIFNNIVFASRPYIIKVSPKSNMVVIWIDIWNFQSSLNTKMLINRCFNIRSRISTIYRTNMNSRVPQCKNC